MGTSTKRNNIYTLRYTAHYPSGAEEVTLLPVSKAIHLPIQFQEGAVWYELLSSDHLPYLIHRYCPMMHFKPASNFTETYAELYELSFIVAHTLIKNLIGSEYFQNEIYGMLQAMDELEERCRQQDLYQNGRVDY